MWEGAGGLANNVRISPVFQLPPTTLLPQEQPSNSHGTMTCRLSFRMGGWGPMDRMSCPWQQDSTADRFNLRKAARVKTGTGQLRVV